MLEDIVNYYEKAGFSGACAQYYIVRRARLVREATGVRVCPTKEEVVVPDFALFRAPDYDYLPHTSPTKGSELYRLGERVVLLGKEYFGCRGRVTKLTHDELEVRLSEDPVISSQKI